TLPAYEWHENGNVLAAARQLERNLAQRCRSALGTIQDALGQGMTDAVGVHILDVLANAIWARMDDFPCERVLVQHEAVVGILELGVIGQNMLRHKPELAIEPVEDIVALDTDLLDHLLIEIVQKLFARILLAFRNLRF